MNLSVSGYVGSLCIPVTMSFLVYSYCMGLGAGMGPGTGSGLMASITLHRNVHTGPRQGRGPGPIVSYCKNLIPFAGLGPGPISVWICHYYQVMKIPKGNHIQWKKVRPVKPFEDAQHTRTVREITYSCLSEHDVKIFRRYLPMSTPNCRILWYRLRSPNSWVWTHADRKCSRNTPREFRLGRENDSPTGWTFTQLNSGEEFHLVTLAHQRKSTSLPHCY